MAETTTTAVPESDEPDESGQAYTNLDKIRAAAGLALGLFLVFISIDTLTGGKISGNR